MNEPDKIDDLFRANSDYLADQPHRDFDPEAFWQQLRPELAQPKRKVAGWWWASAAVLALALLMGALWWMQAGQIASGNVVAEKPAVSPPSPKTETVPLTEPLTPAKKEIRESQVALHKATRKPPIPPDVSKKIPELRKKSSARDFSIPEVVAREEEVASTESPLEPANVPAPEIPTPKLEKPRYRIVHLNEIQPQKEQKSQSRPQLALRVGVTGTSAPVVTEPKIQLAIPINN